MKVTQYFEDNGFELLYVYIKGINRCYKDNYFSFTNEYNITYDSNNKNIEILKNNNNKLKNFFAENISSINLIVGKNGSGKTTLLNLIGLKKEDRYSEFDYNRDTDGWFAVYKCRDENEFYIEGENPKLLSIAEKKANEDGSKGKTYSIHIQYDFRSNKICEDKETIVFSGSHRHNDYPYIFYNYHHSNSKLLKQNEINKKDDYSHLINRFYIEDGNIFDLYKLATENKRYFKIITNNAIKIIVRLKNYFNDDEDIQELDEILCRKIDNKFDKPNKIELLFCEIIKNAVFDLFVNCMDYNNKQDYLNKLKSMKDKNDIIDQLQSIFNITCSISNEKANGVMAYDDFMVRIYDIITKMPNDYIIFKNNRNKYNNVKIEIDLNDHFNEKVYEFLEKIRLEDNNSIFLYNFQQMFDVYLNNVISEGELTFIHTFTGIYYALTNKNIWKKQKTVIIILDEPDLSFHPQWTASFIKNLTDLIANYNNQNIKYQFIISTHSPFMISDVPKENIICIDIDDNNNRKVKKAKSSFASNYYDIIKDSFFLTSPIGEFAKEKINDVINLINNYNEENLEKINNLISVIDDQYLKRVLRNMLNDQVSKNCTKKSLMCEKIELEKRLAEINTELQSGEIE